MKILQTVRKSFHFNSRARISLLVFLFLSQILSAQTQTLPYYGAEFSTQKDQLKGEELANLLKTILKSGHVQNSKFEFDQLVPSCDSTAGCVMQTAYGYDRARQFLFGRFYLIQSGASYGIQEMYCDRVYTTADFKSGLNTPAPGQVPDGTVINVEHTWPQSRFTGKYSKEMQKSDLHHLFPTDSQLNSLRGNTIFGEVVRDSNKTKCSVSRYGQGAGTTRAVFEPPQNHKRRVARALFYFSVRYDLPIDAAEEEILRKWHREVPVDEQEMSRNDAIQKLQGNRNPFIDYPELVEKINNF